MNPIIFPPDLLESYLHEAIEADTEAELEEQHIYWGGKGTSKRKRVKAKMSRERFWSMIHKFSTNNSEKEKTNLIICRRILPIFVLKIYHFIISKTCFCKYTIAKS